MPLLVESLKNRIVSELMSQGLAEPTSGQIEKFAEAIAKAVIDEITQNAVVTTTVTSVVTGT